MTTGKPREIKDKDVRWFGVIMLIGTGLIGGWLWLKAAKAGQSGGATPIVLWCICLLYTSPSPRDGLLSRMPSSA